jgi:hypothetical protein
MARRAPRAFAPFRQVGLGVTDASPGGQLHGMLSAYRFPTDEFGRSEGDSGGYALASRLVWLPVFEDDGRRLVHLGLDYSPGDPGDNFRLPCLWGFYSAPNS